MARPPLRLYEQRSTPQGPGLPSIRPSSVGNTIGQALAGVGGGLQDLAQSKMRASQADVEIERLRIAREEDDARAYVATALAEARAEASRIARTAQQEAPDGWRGLSDRVTGEWGQYREQAVSRAPTPTAQRFLTERLSEFEPGYFDGVVEAEQRARGSWRLDSFREASRQLGGVLVADPTQYDSARAELMAVVTSAQDVDANQRRDIGAAIEEELALSAGRGFVERDPNSALRMLRDPNAGGWVARLSAQQRDSLMGTAQAELNRRETQWRSTIASRVGEDLQRIELGLAPRHNVDLRQVENALGADAAMRYEMGREVYTRRDEMRSMGVQDLVTIASTAPQGDEVRGRLLQEARRQAAAAELEQRRDPASYAVATGFLAPGARGEDLQQAFDNGAPQDAGLVLEARGYHIQALADQQGTNPNAPILTPQEAQAMRQRLDALDPAQRVQALAEMRAAGRGRFFDRAIAQVYADQPGAALAGHIAARQGATVRAGGQVISAPTAARRMQYGASLLAAERSGRGGEDGPRRDVAMPSETDLRAVWSRAVGEAFANDATSEQAAYEAYRAYYAGAAAEAGNVSGVIDGRIAEQAAQVATGGIYARRTLLPWGMSASDFRDRVNAQWAQVRSRGGDVADLRPNAATLVAAGQGAGDGAYVYRYRVFVGDVPALDAQGRPVFVDVRAQ